MQNLISILGVVAGITLFVLALVFVAVPLFKGIGWTIGGIFRLIGWVIMHVFEFVGGVLGDTLRFIGSMLVTLILLPLVPLNIVIGRWSAAGHFAEGIKRECHIGSACVYRAVIRRPLKFLLLHSLLEGLEQRLPEAMAGTPGSDRPSSRLGQFDGYTIVGSLRAGGSGAKLYVAQPENDTLRKHPNMPERVVIKAFALTEGSSLPQIVRESRALECAKQLGHVLDHGMDDHRFFYVMPYHPGEHLGVLTRQFHAECGGRGLDRQHLAQVMSYSRDLLATLSAYHKGGLWHKDVKPENVIVHDEHAHLVDLGLVTPLRSAMTLTTHGTEYFRDPEMVRQALRGVKVHQVDGAKFDIYAAGAVLYFMIENTFPAHGGLSRITMPSPEALRWIVRRAMTDYHQRYATADEMLHDLEYVLYAAEPFAVKPADLPSMRASGIGSGAPADAVTAAMNAAGAAIGSAVAAVGAAFGKAGVAGAAGAGSPVAAGVAGMNAAPGVADVRNVGGGFGAGVGGSFGTGTSASNAKASRPKIVVTNWWTGEYRVDDASGGAAGDDAAFNVAPGDTASRVFRRHAAAFREQANNWREQIRSGKMSARKAAKEQIRAARDRAREIRARAGAHRRVVIGAVTPSRTIGVHYTGSPWLFALGFLTLVLVVGGIITGFWSVRHATNNRAATVSTVQLQPVLMVVDSGDPGNPKVKQSIQRVASDYRARGYDVMTAMADDSHLRLLMNQWWKNQSGPADEELENIMAANNAYGILHVTISGDAKHPAKNVRAQVIHSTRPDADSRRRLAVEIDVPSGPAPALPYLLINDHPAKTDPKVEEVVQKAIDAYKGRGWQLQTSDDAEADVRKWLPPGKIDGASTLPPMLHQVLEQGGYGGVLRIDARQGDAPPQDRVIVTIVKRDDIPAPPPAPASPNTTEAPAPAEPTAPANQPG